MRSRSGSRLRATLGSCSTASLPRSVRRSSRCMGLGTTKWNGPGSSNPRNPAQIRSEKLRAIRFDALRFGESQLNSSWIFAAHHYRQFCQATEIRRRSASTCIPLTWLGPAANCAQHLGRHEALSSHRWWGPSEAPMLEAAGRSLDAPPFGNGRVARVGRSWQTVPRRLLWRFRG